MLGTFLLLLRAERQFGFVFRRRGSGEKQHSFGAFVTSTVVKPIIGTVAASRSVTNATLGFTSTDRLRPNLVIPQNRLGKKPFRRHGGNQMPTKSASSLSAIPPRAETFSRAHSGFFIAESVQIHGPPFL